MGKIFKCFVFSITMLMVGCSETYTNKEIVNVSKGIDVGVIRIEAINKLNNHSKLISHGSGFVTTCSKLGTVIVTAAHILSDKYDYLDFKDSKRNSLNINYGRVHILPDDVALIEVKSGNIRPLRRSSLKSIGDPVVAMGYPSNSELRESKGKVISRMIHTSSDVDMGMSGGPVFDRHGNVVGIITLIRYGHDDNGEQVKTSFISPVDF